MGGVPGCSVEHYIIKMLHFILGNMDGDKDAAVVAVPVDYSKAFNRMLHSNIITILSDLKPQIPTCAIRLIKSYLTQRSMCMRYKGATSSFQSCPGGGPQGGLLTGLLFCLQVRKAGSPCPKAGMELYAERRDHPGLEGGPGSPSSVEVEIGQDGQEDITTQRMAVETEPELEVETISAPSMEAETESGLDKERTSSSWMEGEKEPQLEEETPPAPWMESEPAMDPGLIGERTAAPGMEERTEPQLQLCNQTDKTHKKSFVDDLTLLEKISLKSLLEDKQIIGPQPYHGRFNLTHPPSKSILQHLVRYTKENHMLLNSKKTKCMPFNNSMKRDFIPKLSVEEGTYLEVIYRIKLVGLVLTSDLSWKEHVIYTTGRVNKVLWQLIRFKQQGADMEKLVTFYTLKIRSILMFGSVCFHYSLTKEQSRRLELQQKRSLACILGSEYKSYSQALSLTSLPRLDTLREEACTKWALKAQTNPHHSDLFPINPSTVETRHRRKFKEYKCKGSKFYNSAIPAMVRALNTHYLKNEKQTSPPSTSLI